MSTRGRIAPTPSGYLHIGNAVNFVITWLWVRKEGGALRLRIDDSDTTRSKPEYLQDIFTTLSWMGLDWDVGPHTTDEQEKIFSQALRRERYKTMTDKLIAAGKVFACECSRKDLQQRACNCQDKGLDLNQPDTALRVITPIDPVSVNDIKLGVQQIILKDDMKNFIIRRRDGIAAYQLCSVTDDIDHNINLIIRGNDLLSSTAAQIYLASIIGSNNFYSTRFYHHPLLHDDAGHKLSKSAGSLSLKTMREGGVTPQQLYAQICKLLGWNRTFSSANDMLDNGHFTFAHNK